MEKILNYINGELIEPVKRNYLDNYNPSNGEIYSLIPDSDKKDIDLGVFPAEENWFSMEQEELKKLREKIGS